MQCSQFHTNNAYMLSCIQKWGTLLSRLGRHVFTGGLAEEIPFELRQKGKVSFLHEGGSVWARPREEH